jgi:hypothetical protein
MMPASIACAPPFAGLRRFPQGRHFQQWTGDDSKALMKVGYHSLMTCCMTLICLIQVYISAIEGHVPSEMIHCFSSFLEFCYITRQNSHTYKSLLHLEKALDDFNRYREVFRTCGVRPTGFGLPRQHAMKHYPTLIRQFGAPNGLCSSITESKHIKAVKEPWRRSNCYEALGQMLITNQQLDKLAALHVDFARRSMLDGTCLSGVLAELGK